MGELELVFFDELLVNIDFDSMEKVVEVIEGMKGKRSFVIISYIWELLMFVVDWVVVIGNGKFVLSGRVEEV